MAESPLAALEFAVKTGLTAYKYSVKTGNGADLSDFLTAVAAKKPAAFVSYGGFEEGQRYASGVEADDGREMYTIYFIAETDKIRTHINALRAWLRTDGNDIFSDENRKIRRICAQRGAAIRINGADVFELTIAII
jgi:hypothetical protein